MTGYQFTVTCLHCGHPLSHKHNGKVYPQETQALAHCCECGAEYVLQVKLAPLSGPALRESVPHPEVERDLSAPGARLIQTILAVRT